MSKYDGALEWQSGMWRELVAQSEMLNGHLRHGGQLPDRIELRDEMITGMCTLLAAEPFYWEPEYSEMLWDAAADYPSVGSMPVPSDFPCEAGVFYFPKAHEVYLHSDGEAMTWRASGSRASLVEGIGWIPLCRGVDGRILQLHIDEAHHARLGPHEPVGVSFVVYGRSWLDQGYVHHGILTYAPLMFGEMVEAPAYEVAGTTALQFLLAACTFLRQKILTTAPSSAERGLRRRLDRTPSIRARSIRVVSLRKREHSPSSGESKSGPVEWSCQWAVAGHWRNQYLPSSGGHKTIRINPYIKGPEDKPLRVDGRRLFTVNR